MELATEVFKSLDAAQDKGIAPRMEQYMKGHFEFYGVKSPVRKEVCKPIMRAAKKISRDRLIPEINELWNHPKREAQYVALDILISNKKRLLPEDIQQVELWLTKKSWWDTVDGLASHIVGELFKNYPDLINQCVPRWLSSENIWLNRTCLLYQLKYGDKTDFDLLKNYISKLKHKNEFFIQKAIGWSLRQYSKFNPRVVEDFIKTTKLSNLAIKEGMRIIKK